MEETVDEIKEKLQSALTLIDKLKDVNDNKYIGELPHKVIHLKDNPFQRRLDAQRKEVQKLKEENTRINAKLALMEDGNCADVTRQIDQAVVLSQDLENLKRKLVEYEQREAKIMTSFKKTSREFREVCYLLTGYRIDALKDRIYKLSSMYSFKEEDVLLFSISPRGEIELLENDFTADCSKFVSTYLEQGNSFPAFLSAITLHLFNSTTQVFQESMNISTNGDKTIVARSSRR